MRHLLGLIVVAAIVGGAYYLLGLPAFDFKIGSAPASALKIGFVGPLSGEAAVFGEPIKRAVSLAVKDLNTQGRNIEIIYEDGQCSGDKAMAALQKLINFDQVKMVIGGVCSGETLAMAPLAEAEGVILFSPAATSAAISHAGFFVFRNVPADAQSGFTLADFLGDKYKNIAIFSDNSEEAQVFRGIFKDRFTELGGQFVIDSVFTPDAKEKDLRTSIKEKFSAQGGAATTSEAIVINQQTESLAGFLVKEIRRQKIKLPLLGTPIFASPKFLEAAGKAAEGALFLELPSLSKNQLRVQAFLADYQKFFGQPSGEFYLGAAYDAVNILTQAVAVVGNEPVKIRDYLYNLPEYDGLIGKYSFDLNGDVVGLRFIIKEIDVP